MMPDVYLDAVKVHTKPQKQCNLDKNYLILHKLCNIYFHVNHQTNK